MRISDLYAPHGPFVGADLWIVGTGPSMSVFPLDYLRDKTCLLLNDAQRWFPGLGPIAMANSLKFLKLCALPYQLVKGRLKFEPGAAERTDNHCPWDSPRYYVYSYREPPWDTVSHHDEATLFQEPDFYWSPKQGSISAFAMQFAIWAGVRSIHLVGCDCCALNGQDYASQKPKRPGVRHVYPQYAVGILRMMQECRKRGIPVVQVNPFAGIGDEAQQLSTIMEWPNA